MKSDAAREKMWQLFCGNIEFEDIEIRQDLAGSGPGGSGAKEITGG